MVNNSYREEDILLEPPPYIYNNNNELYENNNNINNINTNDLNTNTNTNEVDNNNNNNDNDNDNYNDNDNSSTETLLPDYESINDDDDLINHIYYDPVTNSIRISILRIQNNVRNINKFGLSFIILNFFIFMLTMINYIIYNDNDINNNLNITNYNLLNNNNNTDNELELIRTYNNVFFVFIMLSLFGYVSINILYYSIKPNIFQNENKNIYYYKKRIYNILLIYNQLITLFSIVYIVKYKKINQYYAEIFLFCIHIINFIAEKIINITLNINLFLNIY